MELTEAPKVSLGEQTANVHSSTGKHAAATPGWGERERLIDRDDETAFFWGGGASREGRKPRGLKGSLAGRSVKEGRQNLGLGPERKKRRGFHKTADWRREGGRDGD